MVFTEAMESSNDNFEDDTFVILAAPTAKVVKRLQRHEHQNERGEGDPNASRGYEKDSGEHRRDIEQRRAASG